MAAVWDPARVARARARETRQFLARHPTCESPGCVAPARFVQREAGALSRRGQRAVCGLHSGMRVGNKPSERRAAKPGGNACRPDCGPDHVGQFRRRSP
jgi:hypothetical protein